MPPVEAAIAAIADCCRKTTDSVEGQFQEGRVSQNDGSDGQFLGVVHILLC